MRPAAGGVQVGGQAGQPDRAQAGVAAAQPQLDLGDGGGGPRDDEQLEAVRQAEARQPGQAGRGHGLADPVAAQRLGGAVPRVRAAQLVLRGAAARSAGAGGPARHAGDLAALRLDVDRHRPVAREKVEPEDRARAPAGSRSAPGSGRGRRSPARWRPGARPAPGPGSAARPRWPAGRWRRSSGWPPSRPGARRSRPRPGCRSGGVRAHSGSAPGRREACRRMIEAWTSSTLWASTRSMSRSRTGSSAASRAWSRRAAVRRSRAPSPRWPGGSDQASSSSGWARGPRCRCRSRWWGGVAG